MLWNDALPKVSLHSSVTSEGPRAYSGEVSCQTDKLERDAEAMKGSTTAESQTDKLTTTKRDAEAIKGGKGVFEGTC